MENKKKDWRIYFDIETAPLNSNSFKILPAPSKNKDPFIGTFHLTTKYKPNPLFNYLKTEDKGRESLQIVNRNIDPISEWTQSVDRLTRFYNVPVITAVQGIGGTENEYRQTLLRINREQAERLMLIDHNGSISPYNSGDGIHPRYDVDFNWTAAYESILESSRKIRHDAYVKCLDQIETNLYDQALAYYVVQ